MKINFKMLWPLCGVLIFAVLSLIAFQAIGFVTKVADGGSSDGLMVFHIAKLSDLTKADGKMFDIYCLAVSGLVVSWAAVILPLLGLFFGKMPKFNAALGGIGLFFEVAGVALMIAALSLFITSSGNLVVNKDKPANVFTDVKNNYDKGLAAANYVLIVLGMGASVLGIDYGFFTVTKKPKAKARKK